MICPNKVCKKDIPADSIYCDQCGVLLRQCSVCGSITLAKFCTECGGVVNDRKLTESQKIETEYKLEEVKKQENNSVESVQQGTVIISSVSELKIVHSNFSLNISSGDILGRTTGSHSSLLGQFPVISSKHAKIELLGDEWFITDLHSSNKSYLNGKVLTPDVPTKLTDKDILVLANVNFSVSIK